MNLALADYCQTTAVAGEKREERIEEREGEKRMNRWTEGEKRGKYSERLNNKRRGMI